MKLTNWLDVYWATKIDWKGAKSKHEIERFSCDLMKVNWLSKANALNVNGIVRENASENVIKHVAIGDAYLWVCELI